jgi:hypothetical protein
MLCCKDVDARNKCGHDDEGVACSLDPKNRHGVLDRPVKPDDDAVGLGNASAFSSVVARLDRATQYIRALDVTT